MLATVGFVVQEYVTGTVMQCTADTVYADDGDDDDGDDDDDDDGGHSWSLDMKLHTAQFRMVTCTVWMVTCFAPA